MANISNAKLNDEMATQIPMILGNVYAAGGFKMGRGNLRSLGFENKDYKIKANLSQCEIMPIEASGSMGRPYY